MANNDTQNDTTATETPKAPSILIPGSRTFFGPDRIYVPDGIDAESDAVLDYAVGFGLRLVSEAKEAGIPSLVWSQDVPEGWSMVATVIAENVTDPTTKKGKRVSRAVLIWPVPSVQSFLAAGTEAVLWLENATRTAVSDALARPIRKAKDDAALNDPDLANSIPSSIADIIAESTGGKPAYMKGFNDCAPKYISRLRKAFPKIELFRAMNPALLRSLLSNAAFARATAPMLEEKGQFAVMIVQLKRMAEDEKLPTEVFDTWIAERDEADESEEAQDDDAVDLSGMSF
jgi:hypothetical protein